MDPRDERDATIIEEEDKPADKSLIKETKIAADLQTWLLKVTAFFVQIVCYQKEIERFEANDKKNVEKKGWEKWEKKSKAKLEAIAPGFKRIFSLWDNTDRYFRPLKFLIKMVFILLGAVFVTGAFLLAAAKWLPVFLLDQCMNGLIKIATAGRFQEREKQHVAAEFPKKRAEWIKALREQHPASAKPEIADLSDDALIAHYQALSNQFGGLEIKSRIDNLAKSMAGSSGFTYLKLLALGFYDVLTQNLPEGAINKAAAILAWPLSAAFALPLLLLAATVELADFLLEATFLAGVASLSFVYVSLLFIVNIPLLAIDAVSSPSPSKKSILQEDSDDSPSPSQRERDRTLSEEPLEFSPPTNPFSRRYIDQSLASSRQEAGRQESKVQPIEPSSATYSPSRSLTSGLFSRRLSTASSTTLEVEVHEELNLDRSGSGRSLSRSASGYLSE
jgi:hypothetical protein